mmetsp:Transcript_14610/g.20736  ORF Transcript_14610/g.20736 Transcript_14610/m.20736 type:complete len:87 (-) Transcript_14610:805-1065(-)
MTLSSKLLEMCLKTSSALPFVNVDSTNPRRSPIGFNPCKFFFCQKFIKIFASLAFGNERNKIDPRASHTFDELNSTLFGLKVLQGI